MLGITIFTSKEGDEGPTQEEDEWQTHGGRKPNDGAPDEVPGDKGNREPDQGEAPQGAGEEGQESRGAGHGNAPSECGVLEDQRLGQSASEDAGMAVHGGWWPSKDKAAGSHERGAALPPSDEDLAGLSADLIKRTFGAGRLPKVDGPTPGHQGPDRLEQAKQQIVALQQTPAKNKRKAEVEALGILATAFTTLPIASVLRGLSARIPKRLRPATSPRSRR